MALNVNKILNSISGLGNSAANYATNLFGGLGINTNIPQGENLTNTSFYSDTWKKKPVDPVTTTAPYSTTLSQPYKEVKPWIPNLDINSVYNSAKSKAAGEATSWYNQQLGEFMKIIDWKKGVNQNQYDTNIGSLESQLKNLIEGNVVTRGRTQEDTAYNTQRIREEELARQQSEGRQFDVGRRGLQSSLGASGLATSGLGAQQLEQAGFERKMGEQKQTRAVEEQKLQQEKILGRTFEDLARGEKTKTEETEFGKQQAKISFDDAMIDLADRERSNRISLEQSRSAIQQSLEQANRIQSYLDYFNSLKTNAQKSEASNVYGKFF
jgi:hypothetical protein